jgi:pilus assembly protein CpaF
MAEQDNRLRKLTAGGYASPPYPAAVGAARADATAEYYELKKAIHDRLLDLIDLSRLDSLDGATLRAEIRRLVEQILGEQRDCIPLNLMERERLFTEIEDEVLGLGPLEPYLKDPGISDILVNTFAHIYVERKGKLELTEGRFKDNNHLRRIIEKIVSPLGRRIDESSPMVDARLADGSRVNAIIPPLAIDGPILSIRRFAVDPLELDDLITLRTLTPDIGEFLKAILRARLNVLISGGTGSGKTTLLNVLSRFIPFDERIVTIEDSAELQLKQKHVVRLETRPPNIEGKGEITQRDLVRNSLRMRPDRIIVGEVRGIEVLDMLQAMNTGHDGSLTTIHANSARDALMRIETLVALTGVGIDGIALRRYISAALNVVIHIARMVDGSRKVVSLYEITGMEGDVITMNQIFAFEQTRVDERGYVRGRFRASGVRPKFMERLEVKGITVPPTLFDPEHATEL